MSGASVFTGPKGWLAPLVWHGRRGTGGTEAMAEPVVLWQWCSRLDFLSFGMWRERL